MRRLRVGDASGLVKNTSVNPFIDTGVLPYVMGNGLSVSSIVDKLHALEPEARSAALDDLCEQVR